MVIEKVLLLCVFTIIGWEQNIITESCMLKLSPHMPHVSHAKEPFHFILCMQLLPPLSHCHTSRKPCAFHFVIR